MVIEFRNPATGKVIRKFEEWNSARIDAGLVKAIETFRSYRSTPLSERAAMMKAAASVLQDGRDRFAQRITLEMGKPIGEARAEIVKCAMACDHYAEHGPEYLAPLAVASDASKSYVDYQPLGPILAVMPWNFPFWQVFRFAAPALMAGNTAILKHASNVPGCAQDIEEVFASAGFPRGAFQTFLIGAGAVARLIESPEVKAVTLTGSDGAGRKVARKAGDRLKKTVLELGGSDPFVVLDDADLPSAAKAAALARCQNGGQSCIAAKRFIAMDSVHDEFLELFIAQMEALVVGDPMDEATQVGPQAREEFLLDLHRQVMKSEKAGARVLTGGKPLEREGYFYPPTVLTDVRPGMPVYDEEVFGPVAPVVRAADEAEALRLANDTPYGLGASVWTSDPERGDDLGKSIEAGAVFINSIVKSDPRLPFGGVKQSGYGRELGPWGMREFMNIKTVWIK